MAIHSQSLDAVIVQRDHAVGADRQAAGLEPACAKTCPTGALEFGDWSMADLTLIDLGIAPEVFYDTDRLAIVPMGLCFPGLDARGYDLPPRNVEVTLSLFLGTDQREARSAADRWAPRPRGRVGQKPQARRGRSGGLVLPLAAASGSPASRSSASSRRIAPASRWPP